jgi:beta-N-acetylhexosaminidase
MYNSPFLFSLFSILFITSLEAINPETLNLEEKVGQLLMIHINGKTATDEAKTLLHQAYVGGIIYYNWANGLDSPSQVRQLSEELQMLAAKNPHPIPLLIAVDQEGGRVSRLKNGFTSFPGNHVIAATRNPALAERCACAIGKELQAVGINMNLAPVVDVNSNPSNPVIGNRAFSASPEEVILYAKKALDGYRSSETIATLKHFPGHGDVEVDSHQVLPRITKSMEQLRKTELLPFIQLSAQADVVMTAHLLVDALDPKNCTTLSADSLTFLRNECAFNGLIISDSLIMQGALSDNNPIETIAIRAFNAGCDILLLGGKLLEGTQAGAEFTTENILKIHKALVDAVKEGLISEIRLNQSVQRILSLKDRYLSRPSPFTTLPLDEVVNTPEHSALAEEIIRRSLPEIPPISLSIQDAHAIAEKIWKNECAGSIEGLTCWNQGENFASLGIGHFIWYPFGKKEHFQESFPALLAFLKQQGISIPSFLDNSQGCLWNSRESFYENINSPEMVSLRQFLFNTRDLQAIFIVKKLDSVLPSMLKSAPEEQRQHLEKTFARLQVNPQGLYALIDYLNFKGAGTAASESYNGKRWGLLQVLQGIPDTSRDVVADFVSSAKEVLTQRIEHAPVERNEQRWLKGWLNRVETYLSYEVPKKPNL